MSVAQSCNRHPRSDHVQSAPPVSRRLRVCVGQLGIVADIRRDRIDVKVGTGRVERQVAVVF